MGVVMSTLKVNGLTYRTVEREVERLFDKYGKINEVFIPKDRFSRRSRGFAFVRFVHKDDARNALDDLDRRMFDGRELRIEWSKKDGGNERRAARSKERERTERSRSRERRRRSRSRTPPLHESRGRGEDRGGGSYSDKERRRNPDDRSDSRGGFRDERYSRGDAKSSRQERNARSSKDERNYRTDHRSDRRQELFQRKEST